MIEVMEILGVKREFRESFEEEDERVD